VNNLEQLCSGFSALQIWDIPCIFMGLQLIFNPTDTGYRLHTGDKRLDFMSKNVPLQRHNACICRDIHCVRMRDIASHFGAHTSDERFIRNIIGCKFTCCLCNSPLYSIGNLLRKDFCAIKHSML
jgi:hypothetical protein